MYDPTRMIQPQLIRYYQCRNAKQAHKHAPNQKLNGMPRAARCIDAIQQSMHTVNRSWFDEACLISWKLNFEMLITFTRQN